MRKCLLGGLLSGYLVAFFPLSVQLVILVAIVLFVLFLWASQVLGR